MAKKLGNDYRLWIESATPGTYNEIKGQQDLAVSRSGSAVDMSTKDDGNYGTQAPGLRALTISYSLIPNLPDSTGYTRLETFANASTQAAFNIQIRKGGSSGATPADVVFAASVYTGDFSQDFGQNGPVRATGTFLLAAVPTTDILA